MGGCKSYHDRGSLRQYHTRGHQSNLCEFYGMKVADGYPNCRNSEYGQLKILTPGFKFKYARCAMWLTTWDETAFFSFPSLFHYDLQSFNCLSLTINCCLCHASTHKTYGVCIVIDLTNKRAEPYVIATNSTQWSNTHASAVATAGAADQTTSARDSTACIQLTERCKLQLQRVFQGWGLLSASQVHISVLHYSSFSDSRRNHTQSLIEKVLLVNSRHKIETCLRYRTPWYYFSGDVFSMIPLSVLLAPSLSRK